MWKIILSVGAGGFAGSITRFLVSRYIQQHMMSSFPHGTFWVNITGCFLIGFFFGWFQEKELFSPELRMFLTVGFCGGFTTFSSFALENIGLLRAGETGYFFLYTILSVVTGLLATYAGYIVIKSI